MTAYDVFNGDADGICALTQLRNAEPREAVLVTGVKRDIQLLDNIDAREGDEITVLDISLDKNRAGLQRALDAGATVFYADHHFAGEIPDSPQLKALINTAADVCTSVLINSHLEGEYVEWAVAGAFGDNLKVTARSLVQPLALKDSQVELLENLGTYINYNGYGSSLEDLIFAPDELYRLVCHYASPFDFVEEGREHFQRLETGYRDDMAAASGTQPELLRESVAAFLLPDEPWARRVSGVYSNQLANSAPDRAHAVLTEKANGNYLISVRAPLNRKTGADELCRQFPTGGGRAAAAGVNDLPPDQLQHFLDTFAGFYESR